MLQTASCEHMHCTRDQLEQLSSLCAAACCDGLQPFLVELRCCGAPTTAAVCVKLYCF